MSQSYFFNTVFGGGPISPFNFSGNPEAASFSTGGSALYLYDVYLEVFAPSSNGSVLPGTLTISLDSDNGGTPGTSLATVATIDNTNLLPDTGGTTPTLFGVSTSILLSPDTRYWIELSDTASSNVIWNNQTQAGPADVGSTTEYFDVGGAVSPNVVNGKDEAFAMAVIGSTTPPSCVAAGTRIAGEFGDVPVEHLRAGDRVKAPAGELIPVIWVGHQHFICARHPAPETVWPVRIRAGAFGEGRPCRDLFLSPDHAVLVGGVLIPARLLVDGGAIAPVPVDEVTWYHVELPRHDVLLAEGLPVESYLDTGNRASFAGGGTIRLPPETAATPGPAHQWETRGAAPLVVTGAPLRAARAAVAAGVSV